MAYGEAKLFVGVDITSIYKAENVFEEITKYNENTGKPYISKVRKETIHKFGNIEITSLYSWKGYENYFTKLGLDIVTLEYMGVKIAECDENDLWKGELYLIEEAKTKLQSILDNLGWQLPIKLYLETEFYSD